MADLVPVRWLRGRLRIWSAGDPRLSFGDGDELVAAAQRRDVTSWTERDQVLSALIERAVDDGLARRARISSIQKRKTSSGTVQSKSPSGPTM